MNSNLFFSNAFAAPLAASFSLCDASLGGIGFDCNIIPNDKEVLTYNESTGKWQPMAVNGLSYQGAWDALNSAIPNTTVKGNYYIVSVANSPYQVGDWIVYNGTTFDRIDNSQMISSVFGRTGVVTALKGDYNLDKLSDVTISSPITNQVLHFNGTSWVNATEADPSASAFAKVNLPVCSANQVLKSDGTAFSCVTDHVSSVFSGTPSRVVVTDGTGALSSSSISTTIFNYLSNVTSDIQTQIAAKLNSTSFIDWSTTGSEKIHLDRINLTTANRVVVTNASSNPATSNVTTAELGYVTGVTSSIQTQLNSKLGTVTETDPTVSAFAKTALPNCTAGKVLVSNGTSFSCVTDNSGAGAFTGTINRAVVTNATTGDLTVSNTTNTEVGYLSGVTSNIGTQLGTKQAAITTASVVATGTIQTNLQNGVEVKPFGTTAGNTGEFRFYELAANGSHYTGFKAPNLLNANIIYTLPGTIPGNGYVLSSTAGGVLSWVPVSSTSVISINTLTGAVSFTTTEATEGSKLYHTDARVLATPITAPTLTNSAIATSDTVQVSLGKIQAQINSKEASIGTGTTSQYYRGDKSFQTLDTLAIPESTNLYFTNARARTAVVVDSISDGVLNTAPSQNAVYDALGLKLNAASAFPWNTSGSETIYPTRLSLGVSNAGKAVVTDNNGLFIAGSATSTELGYLSGTTSSIQTQLNAKLDSTSLANAVRSTTLTGLSLATNAAIQATDTVIVALGLLQKQINDFGTDKLSLSGDLLTSGTIAGLPIPVSSNQAANKSYVDSLGLSCPINYILIPADGTYASKSFCAAKYEMKNDGYGTAVSTASGTPWVGLDRPTSRSKCQALGMGYDMMSNNQWQAIARNIAAVGSNWSTGTVGSGQLNRGNSDNATPSALAAVTDDNDPCNGTGQTCSGSTWHSQRRTHTLSNGNIIWDMAGNVWEWVVNADLTSAPGTDGYVSSFANAGAMQVRFGPASSTLCAGTGTTPYCGMGYAYVTTFNGAIMRGGVASGMDKTGIFTAGLLIANSYTSTGTGFRCVFTP